MSSAQRGLIGVIDLALSRDADMLLLAGDLFDHNRVRQPCLDFASEQLSRLSCPIVMIAGNHDCLAEYSIYHTYDPRDAGGHIHLIRDEAGTHFAIDELGVQIWGRGIVDHHPDNKPLADVPARHDTDTWFIGLAHGYYVNRGAGMFSSLITPEEIAASGLDYLALGHVHVYSEIRHGETLAAYPGSPNHDQGAREMTAAEVSFEPEHGASVKSVTLDLGGGDAG